MDLLIYTGAPLYGSFLQSVAYYEYFGLLHPKGQCFSQGRPGLLKPVPGHIRYIASQTLFECAISQLAVYEIKNSKRYIHPGITAPKPETLMQSVLKIDIKKANEQNERCVTLCSLGSNNSSTAFNVCTDQQDS